jgi:hypothetical protein
LITPRRRPPKRTYPCVRFGLSERLVHRGKDAPFYSPPPIRHRGVGIGLDAPAPERPHVPGWGTRFSSAFPAFVPLRDAADRGALPGRWAKP